MGNTGLAVAEDVKYSGLLITSQDPSSCEARTRLGIARSIINNQIIVRKPSSIGRELRKAGIAVSPECGTVWVQELDAEVR